MSFDIFSISPSQKLFTSNSLSTVDTSAYLPNDVRTHSRNTRNLRTDYLAATHNCRYLYVPTYDVRTHSRNTRNEHTNPVELLC